MYRLVVSCFSVVCLLITFTRSTSAETVAESTLINGTITPPSAALIQSPKPAPKATPATIPMYSFLKAPPPPKPRASVESKSRPAVVSGFQFSPPGNAYVHSVAGDEAKCWKSDEIELVESLLSQLKSQHPYYIQRVTCYRNISLIRVDEAVSPKYFAAETNGCILFPDKFFTGSGRYETLIHELAHAIDEHHAYSNSKAWCAIVVPRMERFWKEVKTTKKYDELSVSNPKKLDDIAKANSLPTAYAAEDPAECFADCVAELLTRHFKDPEVTSYLLNNVRLDMVQHTNDPFDSGFERCRNTKVELLLHNGEYAYLNGDYDKASMEFQRALFLDHNLPSAQSRMAVIWTKTRDYGSAEICIKEQLHLYNELRIPPQCRSVIQATAYLEQIQSQRSIEAKAVKSYRSYDD